LLSGGKSFHKAFLDENPSLITGESTPSYLLHSDVVTPRVKACAPGAKLTVVLRDPVSRAYSQVRPRALAALLLTSSGRWSYAAVQYQVVVDRDGTPQQKKARSTHWVRRSFEEVRSVSSNWWLSSAPWQGP
jgi:hypothetical protein